LIRNKFWWIGPWFAPESLRHRARRLEKHFHPTNRVVYALKAAADAWERGTITKQQAENRVREARKAVEEPEI